VGGGPTKLKFAKGEAGKEQGKKKLLHSSGEKRREIDFKGKAKEFETQEKGIFKMLRKERGDYNGVEITGN